MFLCSLFWFLFSPKTIAQQQPEEQLLIYWVGGVGCQEVVYQDPRDVKAYELLIQSGQCLKVCNGTTMNFYISPSFQGTTYSNPIWNINFGLGGQVINQNGYSCTVKWGSGLGSVDANVNTANGILDLQDLCVELVKNPLAAFTLAPNQTALSPQDLRVCSLETLYFNNLSNANGGSAIEDYLWDFGDGQTSSEQNPTHVYINPGSYTVKLTVYNGCSCSNTSERKIEVSQKGLDITCASVVCEGQRATYSVPLNEEFRCERYDWSVIGGTIASAQPYTDNIQINWGVLGEEGGILNEGFGFVSLNPRNCNVPCPITTTIKIPVIQNVGRIKGVNVMCGASQETFTLPQWPSTDFIWEVEGDNNAQIQLINTDQRNEVVLSYAGVVPESIVLKCKYQNTLLNCGGSARFPINLKVIASIEGPTDQICPGSSINYNTINGVIGSWKYRKLPNGSFSIPQSGSSFTAIFPTTGDYELVVSGTNFCSSKTQIIKVNLNPPTPIASEIEGLRFICPGTPTTYSCTNSVTGTKICWEFTNPMGVTTAFGEETTQIWSSTFSTTPNYSIKVWRMSLLDSSCISGYLIIPIALPQFDLTIRNADNDHAPCGSSEVNYFVNYQSGESYFWSIYPETAGSVIAGNSTNQVTVLWNEFANPQNAKVLLTMKKCTVQYPNTMDYFNQMQYDVVVGSPQIFIINPPASLCRGELHNFTLGSNPPLTSGIVTWDFGDGTFGYGNSVFHSFDAINNSVVNYTVTVKVLNPNGCISDSRVFATIPVNVAPIASITTIGPTNICPGETINVLMTAIVQSGFGATTSINWYKNGVQLNLPPLTYSYAPTTVGAYYAIVANENCEKKTDVIEIKFKECQSEGCFIVPDPNLTLALNLNCNQVSATNTFVGNPTIEWFPTQYKIASTPNSANFSFPTAGYKTIGYVATYSVNGQPCKDSENLPLFVPYVADIKYVISCGTNGNYSVKLLDYSNYFPSTPPTSFKFYVNGVEQLQAAADGLTDRIISLLPGFYNFEIAIQGSGFPVCTKTTTLDLVAFPDPDFSQTFNCSDRVLNFAVTSPQDPNDTYRWEFDDGSVNLQKNPGKVYANDANHDTKLTITNKYGCTKSLTKTFLVKGNILDGALSASNKVCEGGTMYVSYAPTVGSYPTSYQWMLGTTPVGTTNPLPVTVGGNYWVKIYDVKGCLKEINGSISVNFYSNPNATILGAHNLCLGQSITLNCKDYNPNYIYKWYKNNVLFGNGATVSDTPALGYPEYKLTVTTLSGCMATSTVALNVFTQPELSDITYEITSCNPYQAILHVTANDEGNFNWSNGGFGQDLTVFRGGPYRVTFTSNYGCSSTKTIQLPKNASDYLWVFPKGCYDFCKINANRFLLNPEIAEFTSWDWLYNGNSLSSGAGAITPLSIVSSGTYNLSMSFGECNVTSSPAYINLNPCDECKIMGQVQRIDLVENPYIYYNMVLFINNSSNANMVVTVGSTNGVGIFMPNSVVVPPGGANFTINMLPFDTFTGGSINLILTGRNEEKDTLCVGEVRGFFPPFNVFGERKIASENTILQINPNPSKDTTFLTYNFGNSNRKDRTIEIYDATGKFVYSIIPKLNIDKIEVNLSSYSSGQYIVVMRENGQVVQQKYLMVN